MTHNRIGDAQHAIELCNVLRIGVEIDEGVVTIGKTIDLVSEFALSPHVDVVNDTVAVSSSIAGATKNSSS